MNTKLIKNISHGQVRIITRSFCCPAVKIEDRIMSSGQTQESVYDKVFHSVPARQSQENVASSSNVDIQSKNS